MNEIEIIGAKENNLKNISLKIPKKKIVLITGVSGSGKSSIAFETIYKEGQRRYMDTFSAYARQFIDNYEKPDVDNINGLSPVISIEQRSISKNPRSTVGTVTEIYDYLRLLFAKISYAKSYNTGKKMIKLSSKEIINRIIKKYKKKSVYILSPLIRSRKGNYKTFFMDLLRNGFIKVRINGEIHQIYSGMELDRNKIHNIDLLIDDLIINKTNSSRINRSFELALKKGNGSIIILEKNTLIEDFFSTKLICNESGLSYNEPEPNAFSFNSPRGYCKNCKGIGKVFIINEKKIIPDTNLSISNGGIHPLKNIEDKWIINEVEIILKKYNFKIHEPIKNLSSDCIDAILYGIKNNFKIKNKNIGVSKYYELNFEGIANFIYNQFQETNSKKIKNWSKQYIDYNQCPKCLGNRLKKESLHFFIDKKNISYLANLEIKKLYKWIIKIDKEANKVSKEITKELINRLETLMNLGLGYLTINRESKTLSGGESQRIKLGTQISSELVGVLYILDEPSIGLHQKDNALLIESLKKIRDIGNSIIVVEHDRELIESSDYIIDIGPKAGENGGRIIFEGSFEKLKKYNSLTSKYLINRKKIKIPKRRICSGKFIDLLGASGNNLKNINVRFPLEKLIVITGVSGSGKSTLISKTLYPILNNRINRSVLKTEKYNDIIGISYIDKIILINQSPIGRTPRSNPATYVGIFSFIRELFSNLTKSRVMGLKAGHFSFNITGGRCEECKGSGKELIQMKFLPDFYIECKTCLGKRFQKKILQIKIKEKNIFDVLDMTINESLLFFEKFPKIKRKIQTLIDVGMGYIKLGQPSTELSGGEAQRIKLALELSKKDTGKTLYIFDEPTTGLHFYDINILMKSIHNLVDKGNTCIIIEHNMDVIKQADHIIDLGPNGGDDGGSIICEGKPEEIVNNKISYTAKYLKKEIY